MQRHRRACAGALPSSAAKRCGALLRQFREEKGWTREDLARRAPYGHETIKKFEYGERLPSAAAVNALADALELGAEQRAALQAAAQRASEGTPEAGTPSRVPAPLLVGRDREIALIEQHLDQRLAGEGPPLLVFAGEPGIGKSRLLEEAERRANEQGWRVLHGGCTRRNGQEPYAPFPHVLSRFHEGRLPAERRRNLEGCSWLVRLLPELAEAGIAPAPDWKLPPEQERRLMFAAMRRLLDNIARPAGTLLLLDDLQWAGTDALDLLADLMRSPAQKPLRIVAAYRDTEVRPEDPLAVVLADLAGRGLAAYHPLGPLAPAEARALADNLLTEALEQDDAALVARARRAEQLANRTGGVPFFLVSYALTPCKPDGADGAGAEASWEIPPWNVTTSVQQRVAVLPEAAQYLLGAAAVVGRTVPRSLLLAIAAQEGWSRREALLGLVAACRARLLAEKGKDAYTFVHDLIREVVADDLGWAQRAELHLRVAELLEQAPEGSRERQAAALADHFAQAGERARALPYALAAGDQAEAVYAHGEAEPHYRTAVELARELSDQAREAAALEKLGGVLHTRARYDDALEALESAAELYRMASDSEASARVVARIGWAHAERGTHAAGVARVRQELSNATGLTPRRRAVLFLALAHLYAYKRSVEECLAACTQAMELAREAGDEQTLVRAMAQCARTLSYIGAPEGLAALEEVVARAEAAGDLWSLLRALNGLAQLHECRGQLEPASQYFARAFSVAERLGDPTEMAFALASRGGPAFYRGQWREVRTDSERAEALIRQVPVTVRTAYPLFNVGFLDLCEGKEESAARYLQEALAVAQHCDDLQMQRLTQGLLAEVDLLQGRPAAAQARLEPLLGRPGEQAEDISFMLPMLAWAYLDHGSVAQAEATLVQSLSQAQPLFRLNLLRIQALLCARQGRGQAAEAALEEALTLCRSMPYPWGEAKTLYVYGQVYAAKGEPEQAREKYEAALAICDQLGEGLYRPHIERAIAALDGSATAG